MERNQLEKLFLEGNLPGDLECTSGDQGGRHEAGGRALGGAHPRDLLGCSLEQGPSLLDHVR